MTQSLFVTWRSGGETRVRRIPGRVEPAHASSCGFHRHEDGAMFVG
jgi:hypothetical protein